MHGDIRSALPTLAAVCTLAIALCALTGWLLDIPPLKSVIPREAPVEPNAAVALLLAAVALWRLDSDRTGGRSQRRFDARVMAFVVALVGLSALTEHVFELDLGVGELLFRDTTDVPGSIPGRMSPYSAVAFVGLGVALSAFRTPSLRPLVWTAAALAVSIGAVPLAGYLMDLSLVLTNRWLSPLATTVAFVLLGSAIILSSTRPESPAPRPARTVVERKVIAAFVGALILLFIGAGFTYRASAEFAEVVADISRGEHLQETLNAINASLAGAEAAQMAFFATGSGDQRLEYARLLSATRGYGETLSAIPTDDAEQARDRGALFGVLAQRVAQLSRAMGSYDAGDAATARTELQTTAGAAASLREIAARMEARSENRLSESQAALGRTRQLTLGSLLLTLALAAGIFLTLFRGISREMKARTEVERALRERNREILGLNTALAQRAAEVEAANQELEAFSYSVSHDLRTPLRHIDAYIEMFRSETAGQLSAEAERHLHVISSSSGRMSQLIEDLLAFSRTGRTALNPHRIELKTLVHQVVADLEISARGRKVDWTIADLPVVLGDLSMVRQVLVNLLDNALKYTRGRDCARIEVGASGEENGRCVIYVRDNGAGFDMKYAGRLFGLFQRLHPHDAFEGTGIGLANVRRIIVRHGGRVWAESTPEVGTTFYFTLEPFREAGGKDDNRGSESP